MPALALQRFGMAVAACAGAALLSGCQPDRLLPVAEAAVAQPAPPLPPSAPSSPASTPPSFPPASGPASGPASSPIR